MGRCPVVPSEVQDSQLTDSNSKPNHILHPLPSDVRVLHLLSLAYKLGVFFPHDAAALRNVLHPETTSSTTEESSFIDTRGPAPAPQDTLIHVFIDHSNILVGLLQYVRRHWHRFARSRTRHLSHAALSLILERGRPITRRVLVASSPLHQPVVTAEQLGYEVRVYARVPDNGDGADRQCHAHHNNDTHISARRGRRLDLGPSRNHSYNSGGGGTSTKLEMNESENGNDSGSGHGGASTRVRYREQGVDELLQLKLHQAIADVDEVPHGATIVLATGDGNVGQFNEEGFIGCVRTALKKGWRVELYAWEGGLSNIWKREFGNSAYRSRFEVYTLDWFMADLLDYCATLCFDIRYRLRRRDEHVRGSLLVKWTDNVKCLPYPLHQCLLNSTRPLLVAGMRACTSPT
ncbi:hypothetical protein C8Q72DRAFT_787506 [Fomitopsis betulina]|nr:hypothetical protein C8Q72DRAFT_787506 [Fomitopsis betulina]